MDFSPLTKTKINEIFYINGAKKAGYYYSGRLSM